MTMDRALNAAAVDVEQFSRQGALKLKQKNTQKALEAYQNAYQSSQLLGRNGYIQRACAFNLAAVYILRGNYSDGLIYLKHAKAPDGCQDSGSNGDLYYNFGLAHEGLRNNTEAVYYYKKALMEYQSEDSTSMTVDTLTRLGKVCMACSQFREAEHFKAQLIQLYEQQSDTTRKLQSQAEQANLLLRLDQVQKAETVADVCFTQCQGQEVSNKTVNIFIELSLAYTQIGKYDKALLCCQSALPIAQTPDTDVKQIAVLYQNLGVVYNYLGRYRDAIQYHQAAAKKYAEANNRKSQGHCFINLAYAFSQLKDMNRAEDYFLHSLQAARDSGDMKSEWQSLEALGAVTCYHGDVKGAVDYYKLALTVLAKSADGGDMLAQERILDKLTTVSQLLTGTQKSQESVPAHEKIQNGTSVTVQKRLLQKASSRDGSVIAVRKGQKVKYLRVRRSGTLRRFNKVALGLDPGTTPPHVSGEVNKDMDEESMFSASSIEISDVDEVEEKEDEVTKDSNQARQTGEASQLGSGKSEREDDETDNEESEVEQVFNALQKVADEEGETDSSQTLVTPETNKFEEEDDTLSEDDSSDDTNSSSDEEDLVVMGDKPGPPPIPTMLNQSSHLGTLRTYELPVQPNSRNTTSNLRTGHGLTHEGEETDPGGDGNNFFQEQRPVINKMGAIFNEGREDKMEERRSGEPADGAIYETIRLPTLKENKLEVEKSSRNTYERQDEKTFHEQLPKGTRDIIEYRSFQADKKAGGTSDVTQDAVRSVRKPSAKNVKNPSRLCIVM